MKPTHPRRDRKKRTSPVVDLYEQHLNREFSNEPVSSRERPTLLAQQTKKIKEIKPIQVPPLQAPPHQHPLGLQTDRHRDEGVKKKRVRFIEEDESDANPMSEVECPSDNEQLQPLKQSSNFQKMPKPVGSSSKHQKQFSKPQLVKKPQVVKARESSYGQLFQKQQQKTRRGAASKKAPKATDDKLNVIKYDSKLPLKDQIHKINRQYENYISKHLSAKVLASSPAAKRELSGLAKQSRPKEADHRHKALSAEKKSFMSSSSSYQFKPDNLTKIKGFKIPVDPGFFSDSEAAQRPIKLVNTRDRLSTSPQGLPGQSRAKKQPLHQKSQITKINVESTAKQNFENIVANKKELPKKPTDPHMFSPSVDGHSPHQGSDISEQRLPTQQAPALSHNIDYIAGLQAQISQVESSNSKTSIKHSPYENTRIGPAANPQASGMAHIVHQSSTQKFSEKLKRQRSQDQAQARTGVKPAQQLSSGNSASISDHQIAMRMINLKMVQPEKAVKKSPVGSMGVRIGEGNSRAQKIPNRNSFQMIPVSESRISPFEAEENQFMVDSSTKQLNQRSNLGEELPTNEGAGGGGQEDCTEPLIDDSTPRSSFVVVRASSKQQLARKSSVLSDPKGADLLSQKSQKDQSKNLIKSNIDDFKQRILGQMQLTNKTVEDKRQPPRKGRETPQREGEVPKSHRRKISFLDPRQGGLTERENDLPLKDLDKSITDIHEEAPSRTNSEIHFQIMSQKSQQQDPQVFVKERSPRPKREIDIQASITGRDFDEITKGNSLQSFLVNEQRAANGSLLALSKQVTIRTDTSAQQSHAPQPLLAVPNPSQPPPQPQISMEVSRQGEAQTSPWVPYQEKIEEKKPARRMTRGKKASKQPTRSSGSFKLKTDARKQKVPSLEVVKIDPSLTVTNVTNPKTTTKLNQDLPTCIEDSPAKTSEPVLQMPLEIQVLETLNDDPQLTSKNISPVGGIPQDINRFDSPVLQHPFENPSITVKLGPQQQTNRKVTQQNGFNLTPVDQLPPPTQPKPSLVASSAKNRPPSSIHIRQLSHSRMDQVPQKKENQQVKELLMNPFIGILLERAGSQATTTSVNPDQLQKVSSLVNNAVTKLDPSKEDSQQERQLLHLTKHLCDVIEVFQARELASSRVPKASDAESALAMVKNQRYSQQVEEMSFEYQCQKTQVESLQQVNQSLEQDITRLKQELREAKNLAKTSGVTLTPHDASEYRQELEGSSRPAMRFEGKVEPFGRP